MKNTLKVFYVIIFLILLMLLSFFYNFFVAKKNYKDVNINVKKGATFVQIYKDLKLRYGIIDRIYLKLNGGNVKLKVGTYKVKRKEQERQKLEISEKLKKVKLMELD